MQTVRPAAKQLFCKPSLGETKTQSGFFIPEKAREKLSVAEVINVGAEVKGFEQHEKVVYKPYATIEVKLEGIDYFLIAEEDVLGTIVEVTK